MEIGCTSVRGGILWWDFDVASLETRWCEGFCCLALGLVWNFVGSLLDLDFYRGCRGYVRGFFNCRTVYRETFGDFVGRRIR